MNNMFCQLDVCALSMIPTFYTRRATLLGTPVQSLFNTNSKSASHLAAAQYIQWSSCGEYELLKFKPTSERG